MTNKKCSECGKVVIKCPSCGGIKLRKYGLKNDEQRYWCRNTACSSRIFYLDYAFCNDQPKIIKPQGDIGLGYIKCSKCGIEYVECPFCESINVSKNGYAGGKQRYMCKNVNCFHQTFYLEYVNNVGLSDVGRG